jgi:hypothetical protein
VEYRVNGCSDVIVVSVAIVDIDETYKTSYCAWFYVAVSPSYGRRNIVMNLARNVKVRFQHVNAVKRTLRVVYRVNGRSHDKVVSETIVGIAETYKTSYCAWFYVAVSPSYERRNNVMNLARNVKVRF